MTVTNYVCAMSGYFVVITISKFQNKGLHGFAFERLLTSSQNSFVESERESELNKEGIEMKGVGVQTTK